MSIRSSCLTFHSRRTATPPLNSGVRPTMKHLAIFTLIAIAHVSFLFGVYATGFFGMAKLLPYHVVVAIWLGASSLVAGYAYYKAGAGLHWLSHQAIRIPFSFAAVAISLYIGVFLAFNAFGT